MKTKLVIILLLVLRGVTLCQTNYVFVSNPVTLTDDSALCSSAFWAGLQLGATIAAGLFGFWYVKNIPGGNHEE